MYLYNIYKYSHLIMNKQVKEMEVLLNQNKEHLVNMFLLYF